MERAGSVYGSRRGPKFRQQNLVRTLRRAAEQVRSYWFAPAFCRCHTGSVARDCIIIHGCPGAPEGEGYARPRGYDRHWIPWVRDELNARGIPTIVPLMPTPWAPDYAAYRSAFEQHPAGASTILVGHSCGCAFLVRWLGETKRSIDTLVLVAPWKIPKKGDPVRKAFYEWPIDTTIPDRVGRIVMFTSDTEAKDGQKSLAMYHAALGGTVIDLPGRGHYTSADDQLQQFPEMLDVLG
jgi:predicted alpha/beta hydrolase family esterase